MTGWCGSLTILVLWCGLATGQSEDQALSLETYLQRLGECARAVRTATGPMQAGEDLAVALTECEAGLDRLRVDFPGGSVEVRNDWIEHLRTVASEDIDSATRVRAEVLSRLEAIRREVSQPMLLEPPPNAEAILAQVLSRDEFAFRRESGLEGRWIEWLRRRIEELTEAIGRALETVFGWLERWLGFLVPETGGRTGTNLGRWLLLILSAVALGFLIRALTRLVLARRFRKPRREYGDYEEIIELPRSDELLARAATLRQRGEWRHAVRFVYLASLAFLEERGLVRYDRSKTNWEYARELGPAFAERDRFLGLTRTFDRLWYGMEAATAEDYATFQADFEEIAGRGGDG